LFILFREACTISKPYDMPFFGVSNGAMKKQAQMCADGCEGSNPHVYKIFRIKMRIYENV
jgi:hypothetical protein